MDRAKLILEAAQGMLKVADDIRALADSMQAVCNIVTDSPPEEESGTGSVPGQEAVVDIPLEKVRGILAEKSRNGHTAEVRAIIQKFGADRLSGIDPKDYVAVLAEAEVLK